MSSNHTLVSRSEYQSMQERAARNEAYVISRQEEIDRINRQIADLRNQMEEIHNANRQTIHNVVNAFGSSFYEHAARLRGEVNTQIRRQSDSFQSQLNDMVSQLNSAEDQIGSISSKIESFATEYNNAFQEYSNFNSDVKNRAIAIKDEVDSLIQRIEELSPTRFFPNEYSAIRYLQSSMNANINAGDYQAALAVSQNAIVDASRLLAQLIVTNEQYNVNFEIARALFNRLDEQIEYLSSKNGELNIEIDGEQCAIDYDISRWSFGKYDNIVAEIHRLKDLVNGNQLNVEQMISLIPQLHTLEEQLRECDLAARKERMCSLATEDTVNIIHGVLTKQGWDLDESGFIEEDNRNPYCLRYVDGSGNVVSIVASPETIKSPSFFVEVFSDDEVLANNTKKEINSLLEENGLQIDGFEHRDDCDCNSDPETFENNIVEEALQELEIRR